ncbi:MAG: hypothetical protein R3C26_00685 [Calditrichia bacterium]
MAICFAVVAAVAQTTDAVKNELYSIFDDEWQFRLQENPDLAVSMGKAEFAGKLPAVSAVDELRRAEFDRGLLQRLARSIAKNCRKRIASITMCSNLFWKIALRKLSTNHISRRSAAKVGFTLRFCL